MFENYEFDRARVQKVLGWLMLVQIAMMGLVVFTVMKTHYMLEGVEGQVAMALAVPLVTVVLQLFATFVVKAAVRQNRPWAVPGVIIVAFIALNALLTIPLALYLGYLLLPAEVRASIVAEYRALKSKNPTT